MELYITSRAEWHEWLELNHLTTRLRRIDKIVSLSEKNIRPGLF